MGYDFPGNARELRYLVERAAVLCRSGLILPEHLCLPQTSVSAVPPEPKCIRSESTTSATDHERARILGALEKTHRNRRDAAQILGLPYSTLRYKIQKLGIT